MDKTKPIATEKDFFLQLYELGQIWKNLSNVDQLDLGDVTMTINKILNPEVILDVLKSSTGFGIEEEPTECEDWVLQANFFCETEILNEDLEEEAALYIYITIYFDIVSNTTTLYVTYEHSDY